METCYCIDDFFGLIGSKKIWVYGVGYVANHFLMGLKKHGMDRKVQGYIVSRIKEKQNYADGLPVKTIENIEVDNASIICIAVHEIYRDEIELGLTQKGILNYVWIYPFLYELLMGIPVKKKEWVDTIKLIPTDRKHYAMAVRWAAIYDFYGIYPGGLMLYKKAMAIHSNTNTAETRAKRFISLIQDWNTFGYQPQWRISINTQYEIIDGEHRVALALYHNQDKVQCTVYEGKNFHGEKTLMTEKVLLQNGFIQDEICKLNEINKSIRAAILRREGIC